MTIGNQGIIPYFLLFPRGIKNTSSVEKMSSFNFLLCLCPFRGNSKVGACPRCYHVREERVDPGEVGLSGSSKRESRKIANDTPEIFPFYFFF